MAVQALYKLDKNPTLLVLLLFSFLLVGCAGLPPEPVHSVEWQAHQQELASLTQYTLSGKLAYISPEERQSLNLHWKQSPAKSNLTLTTFLGQSALDLKFNAMEAEVVTHDGRTFNHPNVNLLVTKLTGMQIPVKQMTQWVKGSPEGAAGYEVNELNTLSELTADISGRQWLITYNRYQQQGDILLPALITMKSGDQTIKLSISNWTIKQ